MSELITNLQNCKATSVFAKEFIQDFTNFDEVVFEIRESLSNSPQVENIGVACAEIYTLVERNQVEIEDFDPILEDASVKTVFLVSVCGCNELLLDAAFILKSPQYLAYVLDDLNSNVNFQYFAKMYNNYKAHVSSLNVIARKYFNIKDVVAERFELERVVDTLKEMTNTGDNSTNDN